MLIPTIVRLSKIYPREEDFSADLARNLSFLGIGRFEEGETEAPVGTRRADIVAIGDDGFLVVECQYGKADWDHWGRLEAYTRLREAKVAVLVAEDFEDLMMSTCELRNVDSEIGWYLIRARGTANNEVIFQIVEGPNIEIQTEHAGGVSEFWKPIRSQGLFAGRPVPEGESWISKALRGIAISLIANVGATKVQVEWPLDRIGERDAYLEKFSDYDVHPRETGRVAMIEIPIFDFGRGERGRWEEVRSRLVDVGSAAYEIIRQPLE